MVQLQQDMYLKVVLLKQKELVLMQKVVHIRALWMHLDMVHMLKVLKQRH